MVPPRTFILALISSLLIASPASRADGGHGGGGGGNGGSGSSNNQSGSTNAAAAVRDAQRELKNAADAAERVVKDAKDAGVRRIYQLRAMGASTAEMSAYLAESLATVASLTSAGVQQIQTLKASLLAGLPASATSSQRRTIENAVTAAVAKVNKRQRSASQDLNRAVTGRIPANVGREHPFPEHGPDHQ